MHYLTEGQVTKGIPQGSVLRPLLFSIFINDMVDKVEDVGILLYADDVKLYKGINKASDAKALQGALDALTEWTKKKLHVNIDKTKCMSFTKKTQYVVTNYYVQGAQIEKVSEYKDLGIIFDCKLLFDEHVTTIVNNRIYS